MRDKSFLIRHSFGEFDLLVTECYCLDMFFRNFQGTRVMLDLAQFENIDISDRVGTSFKCGLWKILTS